MRVEVCKEAVEEREEVSGGWGEALEFVEVFFDLKDLS